MSSFPEIVAQLFLLLQCLTPLTHINCLSRKEYEDQEKVNLDRTGVYARIQKIITLSLNDDLLCGAAWIDEEYLISAASCLDNNGKDKLKVKSLMDSYFDVNIYPMSKQSNRFRTWMIYGTGNPFVFKGRGVAHPLFQRGGPKNLPIAYDVAIIRADFKKNKPIFHLVARLCSKPYETNIQDYRREYTAVAMRIDPPRGQRMGTVHEYKLDLEVNKTKITTKYENKTVFGWTGVYYIDPSKQFVMYLEDPQINLTTKDQKEEWKWKRGQKYSDDILLEPPVHDSLDISKTSSSAGGPIFSENPEERKQRCIAGIMSFRGRIKDYQFLITSTKINVDLLDWVEHTKRVLDNRSKDKKITSKILSKPTRNGDKKFEREWWISEATKQNIGINRIVNGKVEFKPAGSSAMEE